jgi:predicted nucleic acid-binding protein
MRVFVVDASVVIRWFYPSSESTASTRLLEECHTYVAPDALFPDIGRIVQRQTRRQRLRPTQARQLMVDLAKIAVYTISSRGLAPDACALAAISGHSFRDAMYLALAVRLRTQLITADTRLQKAAVGTPILAAHILNVQDWAAATGWP